MSDLISEADRRALVRAADLTGAAAAWLDADWTFLDVNENGAALLRRPLDEVVGQAYGEVLPQQSGDPTFTRLRRAMADRQRDEFEEFAPDVGRWVRRQCFPTEGGGLLVVLHDVTAQHQAETEALRTRALLAAVGEALPDAIAVVDEDRRLVVANGAARRLFGSDAAVEAFSGSAVGTDGALSASVDDAASFAASVEALYRGGVPRREDVALADGRTLTRDYVPISLGPSDRAGSVWVYREVSADRERESRAARQKAFLETVAGAVPDTLYLYDVEADAYELVNDGDLAVLLSGPADDARRATRRDERGALGDAAVRTERFDAPSSDGETCWYEVRESRFSADAEGRTAVVIGLLRDVTGQVRAEDALRKQQAFTDHLLQSVPDLVYVFDAVRSENVWANRELTETLGYSQEEIHGMGGRVVQALVHPDDLEQIPGHWARRDALPDGTFVEFEYRIRHKDGSWRWLLTREIVLERDADGRTLTALGVAQDVTVRREAQEALAAWGRLQSRVAQALQRPLLTAPRASGRTSTAVFPLYRSAQDGASIGGDLFDVVYLPEGRVALVVGDVTGKGLRAAASTAQVKFMLRTLLLEGHPPQAALARLNAHLVRASVEAEAGLGRDLFVAVSVAVLDPAAGTVRFAVAGAEPPLVVRRGGPPSVDTVRCGGVPLAFLPDWEQDGPDARLDLGPGDLVVLYTDGLTEAHTAGGPMFGVEGVVRALEDQDGSRPLSEIAEAVADRALAFADGHQQDDVCLLLGRTQDEA